jgi:hypothetical protein
LIAMRESCIAMHVDETQVRERRSSVLDFMRVASIRQGNAPHRTWGSIPGSSRVAARATLVSEPASARSRAAMGAT